MARRFAVVALVAAVLAAGCGGGVGPDFVAPAPRPATAEALIGPWQAQPFVLDPAFMANVAAACRREIEMPAGAMPAVIDARGAGVVTVRMTGPEAGSCDALQVSREGRIWGAGGGWRGDDHDDGRAPAPGTIQAVETQRVEGGDLAVTGVSVYGRVGPGTAQVRILTPGGVTVLATLAGSWFAAWWPERLPNNVGRPGPLPHFAVQAYDSTGALVDEHVQ